MNKFELDDLVQSILALKVGEQLVVPNQKTQSNFYRNMRGRVLAMNKDFKIKCMTTDMGLHVMRVK